MMCKCYVLYWRQKCVKFEICVSQDINNHILIFQYQTYDMYYIQTCLHYALFGDRDMNQNTVKIYAPKNIL